MGVAWVEYESNNSTSLQKPGLCAYVGCGGVWLGPQASSLCSVVCCAVDDRWMALRTAERRKRAPMVEGRLPYFLPPNLGQRKQNGQRLLVGHDQGGCGMVKIFVGCSEPVWSYWESAMCRMSGVGAGREQCNYRGRTPCVTGDAKSVLGVGKSYPVHTVMFWRPWVQG